MLATRRMVAVDEEAERVQRQVLGQRHADSELALVDRYAASRFVKCEPESRAVRRMEREPDRAPARTARHPLAQDGDVRVVAAEDLLVERLLAGPHERGCGAGDGLAAGARLTASCSMPTCVAWWSAM